MLDFSNRMDMKVFRLLWCVFLLNLFAGAAVPVPSAKSSSPNVILITLDTTRADRMGFLGAKLGVTPHLDALARDGVVYTRAYAHVPLTPPSHASMLTGTYPQYNHVSYMGDPLGKDVPYVPSILRAKGYRTGAFVGSMILDPTNLTGIGFDRGFDRYDAGFHQRRKGDDRYTSVERRAEEVVDRATRWAGKRANVPFFMWVHCYDPHGPYDPPSPYKEKYSSDPYDGEIAYTDSAIGKLMTWLKKSGLYENTAVIVAADHGEAFGEHGERHHGILLYDETMHVPLVVKLPGRKPAANAVTTRVRLVDIAPTILQIARQQIPATMQGVTLPGLTGKAENDGPATESADRPAFSESIYAQRAFGWSPLRSWRTGKYLYVRAPEKELYDQGTDAKADHNLALSATAVTNTLEAQLEEFEKKTARSGKVESALKPEQAENLRALGYLPSSATVKETEENGGIDPKSKIELANVLTEALFDAQEGRYEDAIPKLQDVLKQEPKTNLAYFELGRAFARLKDYDQALPLLQEAVKRMPDDGLAHYELARTQVELRNWTEAATEFEAAASRLTRSADIRFYLAVVYERLKRLDDASREFKSALEIDPKHFRANLLFGRLLAMNGRPNEGLPYLKTAARLDPKSVEVHLFLSSTYGALGQEENANRERTEMERLKAAGVASTQ